MFEGSVKGIGEEEEEERKGGEKKRVNNVALLQRKGNDSVVFCQVRRNLSRGRPEGLQG